jgi:hypothetical protein
MSTVRVHIAARRTRAVPGEFRLAPLSLAG